MKTIRSIIITTGLVLASVAAARADLEEDARRLAKETLEQLYSNQVAPVWESLSQRSKNEYRVAFLDYLTSLKDRETRPKSARQPNKLEISFASEEDKKKRAEIESLEPWELELKLRGFSPELDRVSKLSNKEFWQAFQSEQYLKDKESRERGGGISGPLRLNTRKGPFAPTYHIDAVAVAAERVYLVLRAPHGVYHRLFDPLTTVGRRPIARSSGADTPEVHFIWSGTVEGGKLRLDIPNSLIESLKLRTYRFPSNKHQQGEDANADDAEK